MFIINTAWKIFKIAAISYVAYKVISNKAARKFVLGLLLAKGATEVKRLRA